MASDKAALNLRKHAVSFDEASTVFNDPLARIFDDLGHSTTESREIIIGHSVIGRLIMMHSQKVLITLRQAQGERTLGL
jgi:uncharacterized DUF497 family protein